MNCDSRNSHEFRYPTLSKTLETMAMTRILCSLVAACLVCSPIISVAKEKAERKARPKVEEGFVSIFDGKSLDGWWKHDKVPKFHVGGKWEVVDGMIVGDQDPP